MDKVICDKPAGYYRYRNKIKIFRCDNHTLKGDTKIANAPRNLKCAAMIKP